MISQVVHAEIKHPLNVAVPGLLPNSYNVLAVASARIYHAPLSTKHAEWYYSRLRGTLVLGKDVGDSKELGNTDSGIVEAEDNWFRLLDADSGKPVWMFRFHTGLSYRQDRPFFHVFQGRSRRFGFLFQDDDEATTFAKKVSNQTSPPRKQLSLSLSRGKSTSTQRASRRTISPDMVSPPALDSFAHVAHVGITKNGTIEASDGIDTSWKAALGGLQIGRADSKRVVASNGQANLVQGCWKSVDAIARSNSSETTIVDTANTSLWIQPKIGRKMPTSSNSAF